MAEVDELTAYAQRLLAEAKVVAESDDGERKSLSLSSVLAWLPPASEKHETLWASVVLLYHAAYDCMEEGDEHLPELQRRIQQLERILESA
jgi:hypothetical protein